MMSGLYVGHVAHARFTPRPHKLRYRIFMLALDVGELPRLNLRLLKHNRSALFQIMDRDHGARVDQPIRPQIERKLADAGIACDGGPITLLTMPRILGYVFNPLSVYFCRRRDGALAALIYEVRNTFGERRDYVLPVGPQLQPFRTAHGADLESVPPSPDEVRDHDRGAPGMAGDLVEQRCEKDFFVSPFMDMGLRYEFRIRPPGDDAVIAMRVMRGDELVLTASFAGVRKGLTDANLLREFVIDPLMTFKAIAGIHWEALKMLVKGLPFLGRPKEARATA